VTSSAAAGPGYRQPGSACGVAAAGRSRRCDRQPPSGGVRSSECLPRRSLYRASGYRLPGRTTTTECASPCWIEVRPPALRKLSHLDVEALPGHARNDGADAGPRGKPVLERGERGRLGARLQKREAKIDDERGRRRSCSSTAITLAAELQVADGETSGRNSHAGGPGNGRRRAHRAYAGHRGRVLRQSPDGRGLMTSSPSLPRALCLRAVATEELCSR
jgi:hypothetical protein